MSDSSLKCSQCGSLHPLDEMELSFKRPDPIAELSEEDRKLKVNESDDLCTIEWKRYFVRAVLPLQVPESEYTYQIGAWVEIDENAFQIVRDNWDNPDQEQIPPFDAKLANEIPLVISTLGLEVQLQLTGPTTRPAINLNRSSHPLYYEQLDGISAHRAFEYTRYFL
ncbi:MAG: DUF2199 domain-containing protein [Acidobacteriota bacterium]